MKVPISSTLLDPSRFFLDEPGRAFEIEVVAGEVTTRAASSLTVEAGLLLADVLDRIMEYDILVGILSELTVTTHRHALEDGE